LLLAKHKKQSPDPTKRDASKEEFGQRALAGGNMWGSLSCLLVQYYWVNIVKDRQCGKTDASKDGAVLLGQHSKVKGGGCPTLRDRLIQPMEAALNQTTFLTQAQALLGKAISEHTTQQNAEVKGIINKDCRVAPKRMPLGARLAVNTHNKGGRFVESVKNARWLMSSQEAGDGFESIVEFQVQIKGHNQQEYEDKCQVVA